MKIGSSEGSQSVSEGLQNKLVSGIFKKRRLNFNYFCLTFFLKNILHNFLNELTLPFVSPWPFFLSLVFSSFYSNFSPSFYSSCFWLYYAFPLPFFPPGSPPSSSSYPAFYFFLLFFYSIFFHLVLSFPSSCSSSFSLLPPVNSPFYCPNPLPPLPPPPQWV